MNLQELELVKHAIQHAHVTGCCEWKESAARLVRQDHRLQEFALNPKEIKKLLVEYVCGGGDKSIIQVPEQRKFNREYYYKVIVPVAGLARGLFVEIELVDDDPELPSVRMVSAHEQHP